MRNRLEELKVLGVDAEGAVRRFAGNAALYEKFLLKFLKDENYTKAKDALSAENWEELFVAAHTLKGVAGNLGLTEIFSVCSEIVASLRADDKKSAAAAFPRLTKSYSEVCAVLAEEEE